MSFFFEKTFTNIDFVYQATTFILSIGMIISALEDIVAWPVFRSTGLLSWKVSRLIDKWYAKGITSKVLNLVLNDRSFVLSFYLRLIFSVILLLFSLSNIISPLLYASEFLLLLLVALRSPYSLDGSYQLYLIILMGLSLGSLFGIQSFTGIFCLGFIAAQVVLSYFISGGVKLLSSFWRKGYAMNMVFGTKIYGHALMYNLVSRSAMISIFLSWSVMLFETFFFTIFFFDANYAIIFISLGILFHLSNALFMGLNGFFWAFTAAYPALLYFVFMKKHFSFF